jgi:hypothetical protein
MNIVFQNLSGYIEAKLHPVLQTSGTVATHILIWVAAES